MSPVSDVLDALKSVDSFHENCYLMFMDLINSFRNAAKVSPKLSDFKQHLTDYNHGQVHKSEHHAKYAFKATKSGQNRAYFIMMIVTKSNSNVDDSYKRVCESLGVDIKFPLVLTTGIIEPTDPTILDDYPKFRMWIDQTILNRGKDIPEAQTLPSIKNGSSYKLNNFMDLYIQAHTSSVCHFKIRSLLDIKDSNQVVEIAEELLNMDM